jgi:itaconate CoA-transferase
MARQRGMPRPLEGVLVVSLEQAVAAPVCTARLADAGARVIKVERPEGDFARGYDDFVKGEASYFVWANRGKQSIRLDLKTPADLAVMQNMVAGADVFVQNLAVGAAARLGLGADTLRDCHPRLITCAISGYGEEGAYSDMKAYDLLIQAESGLSAISGGARIGVSVADIVTGINAHGAILEALALRNRSGQGSHVSVSLFDSLADMMAVPLLQQAGTGTAPENLGLRHPSIVPYGSFPTSDGTDMMIAVQNDREWLRLCAQFSGMQALVTDPRFADNKARTANRDILEPLIAAVTAACSADALAARLRAAGIAHGRVNDLDKVLAHAALRTGTVTLPDKQMAVIPAPPVRAPWSSVHLGEVPAPGEHDEDLRAEFGPEKFGPVPD